MAFGPWMNILREAVARQRKHAPFFAWFDRSPAGKGIAEAGAVRSLLESMRRNERFEYSHVQATGEEWPDCEAHNASGLLVAFEVTELVDASALSHAKDARPWSDDEFVSGLESLLSQKDQRSFHGGRYAEVVLVIHTDEFYLDAGRASALLTGRRFALRHRNLTRAFLLFSYSPLAGVCPYIELELAA